MEQETKSPVPIVSSRISTPVHYLDETDGALDFEPLKKEGQLIFTEEDVKSSKSPLDYLLRSLFYQTSVTDAYFNARHRQYAGDLNMDFQKATNAKNNLMKALRKGNITISRFIEALVNVLRLSVKDIRWEVIDEKGCVKIIDMTHGYVTKEEAEEMDRKIAAKRSQPPVAAPSVMLKPQVIDVSGI